MIIKEDRQSPNAIRFAGAGVVDEMEPACVEFGCCKTSRLPLPWRDRSRISLARELEPAVSLESICGATPDDGVAEKTSDPKSKGDHVFHWNQEPVETRPEYSSRDHIGRQYANRERQQHDGPPVPSRQPEQQHQRQGHREHLSHVACRTGASRASNPPQTVREILAQITCANVMLDHIGGQYDALTSVGREFTEHKILCQIIFEPVEAADHFNNLAPGDDRRSYGETHAFKHSCDQDSGHEIGVEAGGLKLRP